MAALKYIFAALLVAAVWATVILLGMPMWIAVVATVVILAVLATYVIVKIVRAKKSAREIERALAAQANQQASGARPDLKADVDAMQQEFLKAIAALKSSKLAGKTPAEALYALPWYMIIGPPGSGKSTALRSSGLRFPYMSKSGGGVQGVGGTRNCQWWMTNQAVILDTAGRYTTEDADRDEWLAFLDLLRKNRPKQPINGVMVAISVTDISETHPDDIHTRAREVRARIDEVMSKLEMVVPVYVVFTKVDLIPGFVEIFGDLGNDERRQIWGFTVPITTKTEPQDAFVNHFNELAQTIDRRATRRMGEERRIESRERIYEFPQYFAPMRDKLAAFVGELMAENVYAESPYLRGVYFTSGTQEGRTIDRIMNSMAAAFGIQPKMAYTSPQVEPKSYFLGELFEKVIFPDKNIATRSQARVRKQAFIGHSIAAVLVLVAFAMAILPVIAFRNNRELLNTAATAIDRVDEHVQSGVTDPIHIDKVEPLRKVEETLEQYEADGPPVLYRIGMYQGGRIFGRVRDLYLHTVRQQLLRPLLDLEIEHMQRFVHRYAPIADQPNQDDHRIFAERLRMYLLLTGVPIGEETLQYPPPGEPGLDETQRAWLRETIATTWTGPLQMAGDKASRDSMLRVADTYIGIVASDPHFLFERDVALVDKMRKILKRTNRIDVMLAHLLSDIDVPDKTLFEVTGSQKALANDNKVVPGVYTREAWDQTLRDRLAKPSDELLDQDWVLGLTAEQAAQSREALLDQLRSAYFENYIRAWKSFVGQIYTRAPTDFADANNTLRELTSGSTPPLKLLAANLEYHTTLLDPEPVVDEQSLTDTLVAEAGKQIDKAEAKAAAVAAAAKRALEERRRKRAENPLLKTNEDVKKEFAALIKFGFIPTPVVAEGAPPAPPVPVALDTYQEEIKKVRDALAVKINDETPEATQNLVKTVESAITTTEGLLNETDSQGWNPLLRKTLMPPFLALRQIAGKSASADITNKYCTEVVAPMTLLLGRYPFAKNGKEISPAQLTEFLAPETGKLWVYYNAALAGRVPLKNHTFDLAKTGAAATTHIDPRLVQFLNRAYDLSRVLFPVGSDKILTEFDVQILPNPKLSSTELEIDGQKVKYTNAPDQWAKMQWPGDGDPKGGLIHGKGFGVQGDVQRQGRWGFLRMLEEGTIEGDGALFTVSFDVRDGGAGIIKMRIKPFEPDLNPFFGVSTRPVEFLGVFRHPDLMPPGSIIVGGPSCQ